MENNKSDKEAADFLRELVCFMDSRNEHLNQGKSIEELIAEFKGDKKPVKPKILVEIYNGIIDRVVANTEAKVVIVDRDLINVGESPLIIYDVDGVKENDFFTLFDETDSVEAQIRDELKTIKF